MYRFKQVCAEIAQINSIIKHIFSPAVLQNLSLTQTRNHITLAEHLISQKRAQIRVPTDSLKDRVWLSLGFAFEPTPSF